MAYLLPLWRRLGRIENNGFGVRPVPHTEVEAFQRMEGLTTQEGRALRLMSEAYVDGIRLGGDVFAIPPWDGADG